MFTIWLSQLYIFIICYKLGSSEQSNSAESRKTSITVSSLCGREIAISRSTINWKEFLFDKIINLFRKTFLEVSIIKTYIIVLPHYS